MTKWEKKFHAKLDSGIDELKAAKAHLETKKAETTDAVDEWKDNRELKKLDKRA